MSRNPFVVLLCVTGLIVAAQPFVSAGEPAGTGEASLADIQWLWGEVESVEPDSRSLKVKYLDYDTDEEKVLHVFIADDTVFQEVKGLEEIKPLDTVSVEFTSREGKSYARDITVERVEEAYAEDEELAPPEKVGSGPVTETEGPAVPEDDSVPSVD